MRIMLAGLILTGMQAAAPTAIGGGIIPRIMTTSRCTAAQLLGRF